MNTIAKRESLLSWTFALTLSLSVLLGAASVAVAEDKYWICGSGLWSDGSNWSPPGVPVGGPDVFLGDNAY
jgi:hypothetical protein